MVRILCGTEDITYGEIRTDGRSATPILQGDVATLQRIMRLQQPGQDIESFLLSLPKKLYGVHWAQVLEPKPQAKFNPHHDRTTGRFASGSSGATVAEIAQNMGQAHPGITFSFTGSDVEATRQICQQVEEEFKAYPAVEKTMDYIGDSKDVPKYIVDDFIENTGQTPQQYLGKESIAVTGGIVTKGEQKQVILFNTRFSSNPKVWEENFADMQKRGWVRETKPGVTAAAYSTKHEVGHAIFNALLVEYGDSKGPVPYQSSDTHFGTMQNILNTWFEEHMDRARNTSGYALNGGPHEAIAEGYAQTTMALHPSLFSHDVQKVYAVGLPHGQATVIERPTPLSELSGKEHEKAVADLNRLKQHLGIPVGYME